MDTIENIAEDVRQYALSETAAVMTEYLEIRRYQTVNHYNEVRLALMIKFTLERLNSTEKRTGILRYIWEKWMKQAFIAYTGLNTVRCNPGDNDIVDGVVTCDSALICMVRVLYWILKYRTNYGSQVATANVAQLTTVIEILSYIKVDQQVCNHLVSNFGNMAALTTNDLLNPDITPQPGMIDTADF